MKVKKKRFEVFKESYFTFMNYRNDDLGYMNVLRLGSVISFFILYFLGKLLVKKEIFLSFFSTLTGIEFNVEFYADFLYTLFMSVLIVIISGFIIYKAQKSDSFYFYYLNGLNPRNSINYPIVISIAVVILLFINAFCSSIDYSNMLVFDTSEMSVFSLLNKGVIAPIIEEWVFRYCIPLGLTYLIGNQFKKNHTINTLYISFIYWIFAILSAFIFVYIHNVVDFRLLVFYLLFALIMQFSTCSLGLSVSILIHMFYNISVIILF